MNDLPPSSLRLGPAGWAYPSWDTHFYPSPKPRGFHPLAHLSKFFNTVEINSSFREAIKPEVAHLWVGLVSHRPDFLFTAKLARSFTHENKLDPPSVALFRAGLEPLRAARRLGALVMQFPWSFRFTAANRDYLIELRKAFHGYPLVAEFAHESWMCPEALGTLIDYRIGFGNLDQPSYGRAMPPTSILTNGIGYVRLNGRNYDNWFRDTSGLRERTSRYDYLYTQPELNEWADRIERIGQHAKQVFVVFNNEARAQSLVNAFQMQALLGPASIVPKELLRRYPEALDGFRSNVPVQRSLFADAA
ncbi:MAG: DUF72 domain-containing protein [Bryobacteraceae bacterium]|nr:DUF72 domain-containing protein [Bryobacteraceae bacterium]